MPVFSYKATDSARADTTGAIVADTPRQARDLLRQRGLIVRELAPERAGGSVERSTVARPVRRSLGRHVTAFLRELATLLGVGVPLIEALETLSRQHRGAFHAMLLGLRDAVAGGSSLAQAIRQSGAFDELAIHITEVGEDAGTLDASLSRLADFRERGEQLRGKLATALIYPVIVLCVALLASLFLMTFVVPRILQPLVEQGQTLPLPTRVVKGVSDFIVGWWWAIGATVAGIASAFTAALKTHRGRRVWQRFVLRIPIVGELVRKQAIVRVCIVISTLLKSGIVFARAIQIAQRSTSNLILRDALADCERAIMAGGDIGQAIETSGVFPPLAVQLFTVGQQSGRLEEMLDRLAETYDQQVSSTSQRLTAVLEPLLIVVLAIIVLFVVLATVLPILEAGNAIG